jgi:hypothetical protein
MSQVGTWEPSSGAIAPDRSLLARLARCAEHLDEPGLGLTPDEIVRYAALMRGSPEPWRAAAADLEAPIVEALIRFFTVAEEKLANWEGGAHSPVIALASELRRRGAYPKPLTAWIRAHSQNKFLPWGSLADRL